MPLYNFVPRGFGCVHHSIAILYHEVPNPNLTIRNFFIAAGATLVTAFVPGVLAGNPTYDLFFTVADTQVVTAMKKLRIVRLGFGTS